MARNLIGRPVLLALLLAGSTVVTAPAARAVDARTLDSRGRVLTVGNFAIVPTDGGMALRMEAEDVLTWELHDQDRLLGYGVVPGTEGPGVDATPVLSRDPVSGDIWLAWSRQEAPGLPREISIERFGDRPDSATLRVVASGLGDLVEPALIHDEAGFAFVAWVDETAARRVQILEIAPSGVILGVRDLSQGRSIGNSAPQLGIDSFGQIFAAFLGKDTVLGDRQVYVLAPFERGGGVSHVPNPMIELGLQANLPAPVVRPQDPDGTEAPALHLTVLGGTAIAWWSETSVDNRMLFRYVAQSDHGWSTSAMQTIDLSTGLLGSIPEALNLLEARLRRVVSVTPTSPVLPGLPHTTHPGLIDGRR